MLQRLLATVDRTRELEFPSIRAWGRRLMVEMAFQDWFILTYLAVLAFAVFMAPESAGRTQNLQRLGALTVTVVMGLVAVRGAIITRPIVTGFFYRFLMLGAVLGSYFMLRGLLPVVNWRALDAELYQLDLVMFGFEPTLWMDQFVNPATVQWFSFFYFSYFFLLAVYVLPFMFVCRRMELLADFSLGFISLYCIAHVLYMLVPGWGPYRFLADQFVNPLPMTFWYERVLDAVNGAGAQKDIFPSLHTAGPTFCFVFAYRHRDKLPFTYTWAITGFFAANIIIATMFLRWHYLIDIVAGVALAVGTNFAAAAIIHREVIYRRAQGLMPIWRHVLPHADDRSPVADAAE